jgi:gas vesicle protein
MNKDQAVSFVIGLLAGALIGGVVALLFAPQSGKETREKIKEKSAEVIDTVKAKTSEVVDAVKEKASGAVHAIKS